MKYQLFFVFAFVLGTSFASVTPPQEDVEAPTTTVPSNPNVYTSNIPQPTPETQQPAQANAQPPAIQTPSAYNTCECAPRVAPTPNMANVVAQPPQQTTECTTPTRSYMAPTDTNPVNSGANAPAAPAAAAQPAQPGSSNYTPDNIGVTSIEDEINAQAYSASTLSHPISKIAIVAVSGALLFI